MTIRSANSTQYPILIDIWETSVKASHDFLTVADINTLKPLILEQYFDAVNLFIIEHNQHIHGVIGAHKDNIEMLFISPDCQGKQLGKKLVHYAIHHLNVTKVDVNEQNPKAYGFSGNESLSIGSTKPAFSHFTYATYY
ncbi:GNAT family N-acetyltransferase [Shewanella surugensis]|uniref:GNAT family N-acetyltransferase n=1 Tax=Shewanella surugensis TaxID=212020 RepID=UPI0028A085D5|nr:GNAT family N-acetyltransferase [Shewanella surugensis]